MSVSRQKGLSKGEGLSLDLESVFDEGLIDYEEDIGEFILLEDDTAMLLEDRASSLVLE